MGEAQGLLDRPRLRAGHRSCRPRRRRPRRWRRRSALRGMATDPSARLRPVAAADDRAFRKMRDGPAHRAERRALRRPHGWTAATSVAPSGAARLAVGERADLEIVDDERYRDAAGRAARVRRAARPKWSSARGWSRGRRCAPCAALRPSRSLRRAKRGPSPACAPGRPRCRMRAVGRGEVEMVGRHRGARRPDGRNACAARCRAR